MKKAIIFPLLFLFTPLFAQNIPADWIGSWYGSLEIQSPKELLGTIDLELHINPTESPNKWRYTIVFDDGVGKDEIEYYLIKSDSLVGLYEVDESNGIIIYEIKMGNKMFQGFEENNHVYSSITTYDKNKITWECVSDDETIKYRTGKGTAEIPFLTTFLPSNYQRAILTKKKPKKIPLKKEKDEKK